MQFAWFILHSVQVMYIGCGFPRAYMVCQFIFALSQLVLFMNFYLQTYRNQNEIKKAKTSWQIYMNTHTLKIVVHNKMYFVCA